MLSTNEFHDWELISTSSGLLMKLLAEELLEQQDLVSIKSNIREVSTGNRVMKESWRDRGYELGPMVHLAEDLIKAQFGRGRVWSNIQDQICACDNDYFDIEFDIVQTGLAESIQSTKGSESFSPGVLCQSNNETAEQQGYRSDYENCGHRSALTAIVKTLLREVTSAEMSLSTLCTSSLKSHMRKLYIPAGPCIQHVIRGWLVRKHKTRPNYVLSDGLRQDLSCNLDIYDVVQIAQPVTNDGDDYSPQEFSEYQDVASLAAMGPILSYDVVELAEVGANVLNLTVTFARRLKNRMVYDTVKAVRVFLARPCADMSKKIFGSCMTNLKHELPEPHSFFCTVPPVCPHSKARDWSKAVSMYAAWLSCNIRENSFGLESAQDNSLPFSNYPGLFIESEQDISSLTAEEQNEISPAGSTSEQGQIHRHAVFDAFTGLVYDTHFQRVRLISSWFNQPKCTKFSDINVLASTAKLWPIALFAAHDHGRQSGIYLYFANRIAGGYLRASIITCVKAT